MINWERALLFTLVGILFFFVSPAGRTGPTFFEVYSGVQLGWPVHLGIALGLVTAMAVVIKYGYR